MRWGHFVFFLKLCYGSICSRISACVRTKEFKGTLVSVLFHIIFLIILALIVLPSPKKWSGFDLHGGFNEIKKELEKINSNSNGVALSIQLPVHTPVENSADSHSQPKTRYPDPQPLLSPAASEITPFVTPTNTSSSAANAGNGSSGAGGSFTEGGGYGGRNGKGRGEAVGEGDCTTQGEQAVEAALEWIAAHQRKDGSWSFDFNDSCKQCSRGGMHGSRIAATGLALLPFLGAGYTHQDGRYKSLVDKGLAFLIQNGIEDKRGLAMNRGSQGMYSHGIAAIALCEAYSMSKNKQPRLKDAAQEALRFIENAQCSDGGWRYHPNDLTGGDLSVSAWQIMSLKSGKLAGLFVSQPVIYEALRFLDETADDGGRQYNYRATRLEKRFGTGSDSPKTSTACGLLMRMYLGWKPGEKMLDEGMSIVSSWKPLKNGDTECNLYSAYYVTLALHHYGGSGWQRWNEKLQPFLVQTQATQRHEAGSWFFPDSYCDSGGRLLNTVLATLILETPYRFMPLFRTVKNSPYGNLMHSPGGYSRTPPNRVESYK